jgi:hypothetical protein
VPIAVVLFNAFLLVALALDISLPTFVFSALPDMKVPGTSEFKKALAEDSQSPELPVHPPLMLHAAFALEIRTDTKRIARNPLTDQDTLEPGLPESKSSFNMHITGG